MDAGVPPRVISALCGAGTSIQAKLANPSDLDESSKDKIVDVLSWTDDPRWLADQWVADSAGFTERFARACEFAGIHWSRHTE